MINRSQNDVEAKNQQQEIEIPGVINIEKIQLAINRSLGWRETGVIVLEGVKFLLLNQHADH